MKNLTFTVKGSKLVIEADLSKEIGPSASGKTILIASTGGNAQIADGIFAGVNVYKYAEPKKS
jgi:hypothetical protein